ncbi:protein-tyrosine-phosphatase [Microbacterium saperdae]|uniref:Protein-tyrosine-phosphatase n=1 Tax=Microbacterium saperdae TaxID=69368 RepID=A0A543BC46_9MICO|nr:protein-tyrosine-phosphatase [Microbacterium saperdae]
MHVTHRLIFVCEANVCRSPLMEGALRASSHADGWEISSAGTRVGTGALEMCTVSASLVAAAGGTEAAALTKTHRPAGIDAEDLRAADLILTASRAERSAVAALVPEVRSRTFTLREAAYLGKEPVQPHEFERMAEFASSAVEARGLQLYAEVLHARRGFIALPLARRSLWGKRRRNPYDIPDAHHGSARAHHAMLASTVADVEQLHRQAVEFLDAPTTPSPQPVPVPDKKKHKKQKKQKTPTV